jgi:chromosome segregation ATPase
MTRKLLEKNVQEMAHHNRECESLHGMVIEFVDKCSGLAKEKEEQGRTIKSLQGDIASLRDEKSFPSLRLDVTTEMSREISTNHL